MDHKRKPIDYNPDRKNPKSNLGNMRLWNSRGTQNISAYYGGFRPSVWPTYEPNQNFFPNVLQNWKPLCCKFFFGDVKSVVFGKNCSNIVLVSLFRFLLIFRLSKCWCLDPNHFFPVDYACTTINVSIEILGGKTRPLVTDKHKVWIPNKINFITFRGVFPITRWQRQESN